MHTCPHCQRTIAESVDTLKDNWFSYSCPCGATWEADSENTKAYGLDTPKCGIILFANVAPGTPFADMPRCGVTPTLYNEKNDTHLCKKHTVA